MCPPPPREVVITGTFDERNFGDLLFPLIAADRLAEHGILIRPASPTGRSTGWKDAPVPEPLLDALYGPRLLDGLMIGGGNIVHNRAVTLPDYADVADWAYGSLWIEASLAARRRNVPIVWNAPGVPHPSDDDAELARAAAALANYCAVRDRFSAENLAPVPVSVVPDTALGLARLWSRASLADDFRAMLQRLDAPGNTGFAAIHVKERSVAGPVETLAPAIDAFAARTGLVPILIGIGACHGDDAVSARLARSLTHVCLDLSVPVGLREIAAAIAWSELYVGASMHGYATATVYGRPGTIVGRPRIPKMSGLLEQLGRPQDEVSDWSVALSRANAKPAAPAGVSTPVHEALDAHWHDVAKTLCRHAPAIPDE